MSIICDTCKDTHKMPLHEEGEVTRTVMCTHCPIPCQNCRTGGNGPYCEITPCNCTCHTYNGKYKKRNLTAIEKYREQVLSIMFAELKKDKGRDAILRKLIMQVSELKV